MRFLVRICIVDDLRFALRDLFSFEDISCKEKYYFDVFIGYYDTEECELEQQEDDEWLETNLPLLPVSSAETNN